MRRRNKDGQNKKFQKKSGTNLMKVGPKKYQVLA